jgi:hypothetical protein
MADAPVKKRFRKNIAWRDPRIARLALLLADNARELAELEAVASYVEAEQLDRAAAQRAESTDTRWREFTE